LESVYKVTWNNKIRPKSVFSYGDYLELGF